MSYEVLGWALFLRRLKLLITHHSSLITDQRGVFSPFMFGLLMAVGIFSVLAQQWAKRDLERLQAERMERLEATAADAAEALEFAILTETANTFDQNVDLERILPNTTRTGTTGLNDDLQIVTRDGDRAFDLRGQRVAIGALDDPLARAQLNQAGNAAALTELGDAEGVVVIDTSAVRRRQIETSRAIMQEMASHVFNFYAGNLRFPTDEEYDALARKFRATDAWGAPLDYTLNNDDEAEIAVVTPWGYRQEMELRLDD